MGKPLEVEPVATESYLLACARSIARNPMRARMVAQPEDDPWSSLQHRIGQRQDPGLDIDLGYLSTGRTARQRARHSHDFVTAAIPQDEWPRIRDAIQRGQLTGGERFIEEMAAKMGRWILRRGQGRSQKERQVEK